jgi:hypothetical protein
MNNIIVDNVVEVEVKKNMMNINPRGIIDTHLDGKEFMPGTAIVRTTSNIEDFFRLNTPFIIANKVTDSNQIAASLAALSYMPLTKYNEKVAGVKLMATVGAGFLPIFIGVCAGLQTVFVNSADYVGYEYIIGAFDLSLFLMQPYNNQPVNFVAKKIIDPSSFPDPPKYSVPKEYMDHTSSNGMVDIPMVGRQPFVCTAIAEFLDKCPQYRSYVKNTTSPLKMVTDTLTPLVSGTEPMDIPKIIGLKQSALLKVPIEKFEAQTEAVPVTFLESVTRFGVSGRFAPSTPVPENLNWHYLLGVITPGPFYETFIREDTGEFVFRRAGWINNKGGFPRQKFQNPPVPIIIPRHSVMTHQKLWGGKMGENALISAFGEFSVNLHQYVATGRIGPQNIDKFGTSSLTSRPFDNVDSFSNDGNINMGTRNNPLTFTDVFCASDYFKLSDELKTFSWGAKTGLLPGPPRLRKRYTDNLPKMLSWIAKYQHTYPFVMFLGFNNYFMAPLGAPLSLPLAASPASLAGLTSIASAANNPFVSLEAASSYRIIGKIYKKSMRKDGSFSEEYYLLLGNTVPGFVMNK